MRFTRSLDRGRLTVALLLVVLGALGALGCTRSPEAKSARFMEEGKKLLEKNDPVRAILQFRNAAQTTPKNTEAYYQLALAHLAAGDLRNGVANLRKTLALNPQHREAQLKLAGLMSSANERDVLEDAQGRLRALLQDAPENAEALQALALTELKLGALEDAARHLEQALAAAPREIVLAVNLAQVKLQQKDSHGAEEVLKKACDNFPKSADAAVILGRFYFYQNRGVEAEQQFQKALGMDPNHGAALLNLATLQYKTGRKQDAEQNFRRLSALPNKMFQPFYATFLFQEKRKSEAIKEFEKLAKKDPNDRTARTRLVAAYQDANMLSEAEKVLGEALKKNPKDLDGLLQRGELFLGERKYAQAEADFNSVLRMKPDAPEVHYALGNLHQAIGSPQRQRQDFAEALRLNPFLLPVRIELAKSLIVANAGLAAKDLLDAAPENQRNQIAVIEQRNWAYISVNNTVEARKGVDQGLASVRTPDLLLQDSVLKISALRCVEARKSLHELLERNPEDLRALRALVRSHLAQNQLRAGIAEVREYAAKHPNSAIVQYFWGSLLMETGERIQAKKVLAASKALDPGYAPADFSLAQIDLRESNWKDARNQLNTILAAKGESPLAHQWLGMLEVSSGNQVAAINHFRKVIEAEPNNALALNNLAYLLAEGGDQAQEALKYAEKAKELAPDNPDFEDTLGWVLYRKGVYEVAVRHLESAVSKKPTPLRNYHLAMAYYKAGKQERGRAALTAALRADSNLPEAKIAQEMFRASSASGTSRAVSSK